MTHKNRMIMLSNQTPSQMMGFVIETADGKNIVIDGGTTGDSLHLLDTLRRVTGEEKPHVDAWFLTHNHSDHIDALIDLLNEHEDEFTVDGYYYNFPSDQFLTRHDPTWAEDYIRFRKVQKKLSGKFETVTQGDRYVFGQASIDVLYTYDPAFTENAVNNSSSVLKLTLGGKTVLFLGDLGVEGGEKLLKMHGTALKCDYVQMAHHGQNGVEKDVYEAIAPEACLWCAPEWLWNNDIGKGFNTHGWKTVTVRGWMEDLKVKEHYVIKDGDHEIGLG